MRTGRRPQEIAHAPFKCLEHEQRVREDGKLEYLPVFVYRPEKRPKTRKELPIFAEERRLIKRMQAWRASGSPTPILAGCRCCRARCATATATSRSADNVADEDARMGRARWGADRPGRRAV